MEELKTQVLSQRRKGNGEFEMDSPSNTLVVEEYAIKILEILQDATFRRTRDVIQIDTGKGEKQISILVTYEELQFRIPCIEWTAGSYAPEQTSRLWKRISTNMFDRYSSKKVEERILDYVEQARKTRKQQYQTCKICRRKFIPEHMHDENVCQGCSGTVY